MTVKLPPRDDLIRALDGRLPDSLGGIVLRAAAEDDVTSGDGMTMFGHFAVFDVWTEIDSVWEGNFLERIAPGAFRKTFRENRDHVKVTFQHGRDPQLGDKPLGVIDVLREDEVGAYYEVPLLDAPYVREDLLPGLQAGLYGSSFRFQVMKEEFNQEPEAGEHNPAGLPERTIKEIRLFEFGPVTFPAYTEATAGMRSLTDEFRMPGVRELITALRVDGSTISTTDQGGEEPPGAAALLLEPVMATTPVSRSTPARDFLNPPVERPLGYIEE